MKQLRISLLLSLSFVMILTFSSYAQDNNSEIKSNQSKDEWSPINHSWSEVTTGLSFNLFDLEDEEFKRSSICVQAGGGLHIWGEGKGWFDISMHTDGVLSIGTPNLQNSSICFKLEGSIREGIRMFMVPVSVNLLNYSISTDRNKSTNPNLDFEVLALGIPIKIKTSDGKNEFYLTPMVGWVGRPGVSAYAPDEDGNYRRSNEEYEQIDFGQAKGMEIRGFFGEQFSAAITYMRGEIEKEGYFDPELNPIEFSNGQLNYLDVQGRLKGFPRNWSVIKVSFRLHDYIGVGEDYDYAKLSIQLGYSP